MNQEELNEILEKHKHYLNQDCEGWEYMCAVEYLEKMAKLKNSFN